MSALKEYNALLASGDLKDLFKGLSGDWEKDKKVFTEYYLQNLEVLKQFDVNYEEDL